MSSMGMAWFYRGTVAVSVSYNTGLLAAGLLKPSHWLLLAAIFGYGFTGAMMLMVNDAGGMRQDEEDEHD